MKRVLATLLLLCAGVASAQVYKWVDEKGVTHYSDMPPPPTSKARVEVKSFSGGGGNVELPPELADAVASHPVTLYTTLPCDACNEARAMLMERGIPFSEKTVNTQADQTALKKAGSAGQLPLLLVGAGKQIGYDRATWDSLLSDAGYPAERRLPSNYQFAAAVSAAPPPPPSPQALARAAAKAAAQAAADAAERSPAAPPLNAPPGFQF